MNRTEFEALRDLSDKHITEDVHFARRAALRPVVEADVAIENAHGVQLRMNLHFNPETGSKTVNVYVPGAGPICRLDVDGARHGATGRSAVLIGTFRMASPHALTFQATRCERCSTSSVERCGSKSQDGSSHRRRHDDG